MSHDRYAPSAASRATPAPAASPASSPDAAPRLPYQIKMERLAERLALSKRVYLEAKESRRTATRRATGAKFWEIAVEGNGYVIRFGKVGRPGQTRAKQFGSHEEALLQARYRVWEKAPDYDEPEEPGLGAELVEQGSADEPLAPAAEPANEREIESAIEPLIEPLIWDLSGEPRLGRLRGVERRNRLRGCAPGDPGSPEASRFNQPIDPHFVLRGPAPTEWPDVLTNAEHLLVVSARLRVALQELDPALGFLPVRIDTETGGSIRDREYAIALIASSAAVLDADSEFALGSPQYRELNQPRCAPAKSAAAEASTALYWVRHTHRIAVQPAVADALRGGVFQGIRFRRIGDGSGSAFGLRPSGYEILSAGAEGAALQLLDRDAADAVREGRLVQATQLEAVMVPPRNRRRLVDLMNASGCLVISERIKALFDDARATGIQYVEVRLIDHEGEPRADRYYLANAVVTAPHAVLAESDVGRGSDGRIDAVHELVVDEGRAPAERPILFRLGDAARAWYFLRTDMAERLRQHKAVGWFGLPVTEAAYRTEDLPPL